MHKEVNLYSKKMSRLNRTGWQGSPSRHVLTWSNPKWHNPAGDHIWRQSHRDVEKAVDSKHSKGMSHEPLTSQMLDVAGLPSVISSPALLLDLQDFSPSKTWLTLSFWGKFWPWLLAIFPGRGTHRPGPGTFILQAAGSLRRFHSGCGTSLIATVLSHVVFTLSGFVCFPWAPFGKPLASA